MDFKKLAMFIIALGIVILAVGGGMYIKNKPVSSGMEENWKREYERGNAAKVMIAGAIVSFVGVGLMVSAKKE